MTGSLLSCTGNTRAVWVRGSTMPTALLCWLEVILVVSQCNSFVTSNESVFTGLKVIGVIIFVTSMLQIIVVLIFAADLAVSHGKAYLRRVVSKMSNYSKNRDTGTSRYFAFVKNCMTNSLFDARCMKRVHVKKHLQHFIRHKQVTGGWTW